MSVAVCSAIICAAEAPRDKLRPTESGAGWIPSLTRFLIFGAVMAGARYGWKVYGRRYIRLGGNSDAFGRVGGGLIWADSKRF